ncbi:MAG TPA: M1 family aminopeptidase [Acidobacteriota bacterium]|nr:M1 family aminopeptidase [Acidobacteriota bacterium]
MTRLDLEVRVDPSGHRLMAQGRMLARWPGRAPNHRLVLAFPRANGEFHDASVPAPAALAFSPDRRNLEVEFEEPVPPGGQVEVEFSFRSLPRRLPAADSFAVSERAAVANAGDLWYPYPQGGSFEAPGQLTLQVPPDWRAVATGRLLDKKDSRNGTQGTVWRWQIDADQGRSFAAGELALQRLRRGGLTIDILYPREEISNPLRLARWLEALLRPLQERFGTFPWSPYKVALLPSDTTSVGGAPAHGMFVASAAASRSPEVFEVVFAHESAHAWWWFKVRPEADTALLLSEGLAQYGYLLSLEARQGKSAALSFLNEGLPPLPSVSARGYGEMWRQGRDRPLDKVRGGTPGDDNFRLAWIKGAWVLHMLRRRVGDEVFFQVLRTVLEKFENQRLSLEDLRREFARSSPPQARFQRFWTQWMTRTGMPVLEVESRTAEGREPCRATVRQHTVPYDLDVDIEIRTSSSRRNIRRRIDSRVEAFSFSCPREPFQIRLDPRGELLIWRDAWGSPPG